MAPGVSTLRAAESQALSSKEQAFGGSTSGGGGFYTGSGRDNSTKVKGKGKKKGLITLALIASLMIGGGAFLGSSNSLLAPAMEALFTEQSDAQQYTGSTKRYVSLVAGMLNGKGYDMPEKFSTNLAKNNITVNSNSLSWKGETIPANQIENFYNTNVEFREDFNTAKYGRAMGFYDAPANKTYKKYNVSRNMFSNFKVTGDSEADTKAFNTTMTDKFEGNTSTSLNSKAEVEHEREIKNEKGEVIGTEKYPETEYSGTDKSTTSGADVEVAESKAESYLSGISAKVTKVLDGACGLYRVGNLISMTIAANEKIQSIALFMGIMESISKMKAGYGDSSAINETLNKLNLSVTADFKDAYGNPQKVTGAPLESTGMQAVLGGATKAVGATTLAALSKNFSITRVSTAIFGKGWTSAACSAEQIGSSVFSLAVNLGGGVAGIVGGFAINFIMGVLIGQAINLALRFLVPTIASLFLNYYSTKTGIPFGNAVTAGAFLQSSEIAANSGASPTSKERMISYNKTTNEVLALDAEIERKNHSPFDMTNKNTFFGSIAYSLLPTITSTKMTSLAAFLRSAGSSLATLIGGASAEGEGSSYITTFGDCPDADNNGFAGGMFCETFRTIDLSNINSQPSDSEYKNTIEPNLDCNDSGECSIKKDSNLAKFITYCDGRNSPFGITDAGILSSLRGDSGILGYIPIVGDVVGILDGLSDLENMPWADGTQCINSADNDFWQEEGKWYQLYVQDNRILEQMGSNKKNPVTAYEEEYEKEHPLDNSTTGIIARYTGMSKSDAEIMLAVLDYSDFINNYDPTNRLAMNGNASDLKDGEELVAEFAAEKNTVDLSPVTYVETPLETNIAMREHIVYADVRNRSYVA